MSETTEERLLTLMEAISGEINSIKISIAEQVMALKNHTESDAQNFTALNTTLAQLSAQITSLTTEIHEIQIARAHEAGEREAATRAGRNAAVRWATGIGTGLAGALEALRYLFRDAG